jgi:hypothetical protein
MGLYKYYTHNRMHDASIIYHNIKSMLRLWVWYVCLETFLCHETFQPQPGFQKSLFNYTVNIDLIGEPIMMRLSD